MSGWAKGALAEALKSVTTARDSCLRLVNSAYTSQMDSNTLRLEGRRVGDRFYHVNGDVSHADTNAAVNIKHRGDDTDITLFTPYLEVRKILLSRSAASKETEELEVQDGLDRPFKTLVAGQKWTWAESERRDHM